MLKALRLRSVTLTTFPMWQVKPDSDSNTVLKKANQTGSTRSSNWLAFLHFLKAKDINS